MLKTTRDIVMLYEVGVGEVVLPSGTEGEYMKTLSLPRHSSSCKRPASTVGRFIHPKTGRPFVIFLCDDEFERREREA